MTHRLDTEVFLRLLYFPDFFVDAVSPQPSLAWRRASILRKAPCKKSTSSPFLPRAARSC
jgi:predicted alpha/beta superfamily hydrolase